MFHFDATWKLPVICVFLYGKYTIFYHQLVKWQIKKKRNHRNEMCNIYLCEVRYLKIKSKLKISLPHIRFNSTKINFLKNLLSLSEWYFLKIMMIEKKRSTFKSTSYLENKCQRYWKFTWKFTWKVWGCGVFFIIIHHYNFLNMFC